MLKATIKAVKGSRDKWLGIAAGEIADLGCANCPLCARFTRGYCERENKRGTLVERCPISLKTDQSACRGTPYKDFNLVSTLNGYAKTKKAKSHALGFAKWIEALLPEDEK